MDKAEYIELAPTYYALAIAAVLLNKSGPMTEYKIRSEYPADDDGSPDPGTLLDRILVWQRAISWLEARKMISVRFDRFGPPIYFKAEDFTEKFDDLAGDDDLPFSAYHAAGRSSDWLIPALHGVDNAYDNLAIKAEDFENPDAEWAPLPIERSDPDVEKAISSLQSVIDEVRADNEYASKLPQERDFVLEGLQNTLDKFESPSISAGYIRQGIERLASLGRRFAGTIKEGAISAAKAALIEFGKKHFAQILDGIWRWLI
jgi:hypothetical protein